MCSSQLVTLGVPVFNGERYIASCLASLSAQSHTDVEIVVSDNGSTDATQEIASAFAASDSRIRYFRHPENRGAAFNYNFCVEQARGSHFSWTAHDDTRPPEFVATSLDAFTAGGSDLSVVVGTSDFIDEQGEVIGPDNDFLDARSKRPWIRLGRALASLNFAAPVFGLISVEALERTRLIGGFAASDYVLICELAMVGHIAAIPEPMLGRRLHPESSREANRTRTDVRAWFDPSAGADRLTDRQRLWVEYQRSISRLGLSLPDRLAARATVPAVLSFRRARVVGGAWKSRILQRPDEPHARDVMAARHVEPNPRDEKSASSPDASGDDRSQVDTT